MPKGGKIINLLGQKFGMVTAIEIMGKNKSGNYTWKCICDCGGTKIFSSDYLRSGHTPSCGCKKESHGLRKHPLYRIWAGIKTRCYNPKVRSFKDYGGRGILMCPKWKDSFTSFYNDTISGYKVGLQIERIDNDKGYSPKNCKWGTPKQQANNKRTNVVLTYMGKTQTAPEWAEEIGVKATTITSRNRKGWSAEDCLNRKLYAK